MENVAPRTLVVGHLILTVPAVATLVLVPFFGMHMFGPFLMVYYVTAGLALGWQLRVLIRPIWNNWLLKQPNADLQQVERLNYRKGLAWAGEDICGSLAFHTTAAAVCGIHLGPWLLNQWFVWIMPLIGMVTRTPTGDDYLHYFELASIVPALVLGYLLSTYISKLATAAWILPTLILIYKLATFTSAATSVLAPHSPSRFAYFFIIERSMPTFYDFRGSDPVRVATQMFVVAPFYAALAYSVGAFGGKHNLVRRFFDLSPSAQSDSAIAGTDPKAGTENGAEQVAKYN